MEQLPPVLPVLPIRNAVLFPSISMPLVVGRERSIHAVEIAEAGDSLVVVVAQRVLTPADPQADDLYRTGTLCKIESITRTETGSRQVVVTGIARFKAASFELMPENFLAARGETIDDLPGKEPARIKALFYNLKELSREILALLPGATDPLVRLIERVDDPTYLSNVCAAYLNLPLAKKQELLETVEVEARMESLMTHMRKERETLSLQHEIRGKMAERLNKAQREALLREQLRTIRSELGEESEEGETDTLSQRLLEAGLPAHARKQADEELKRLRGLPPSSAEYHVIRTYLDWVAALPWSRRDETHIDLELARRVLDEDHSGLEEVKKRILQFLAVTRLKSESQPALDAGRLRGPILCLVGPPGVGKTSLGRSIARALQRKFVRASLGGVRDEAEIRGHRRTYVGALPGRILQGLKRAGTRNPVIMLDEIDKLKMDFQGDPASALLEVLDPEQNHSFTDHYLDLEFDLSEVFFVATANVADTIPAPLRDRMEIIEVSGYTGAEKFEIARKHLLPKLSLEHGIAPQWLELPDDSLRLLIERYTREAGVRDLQRKLATLFRAAAEQIIGQRDQYNAAGKPQPEPHSRFETERLRATLGAPRFIPEELYKKSRPGIATGMAWTPHGGDLLHIEATSMPQGRGALILTGQLGDVMKESAQIALSLSRTAAFGFSGLRFDFATTDIHIHVPAGAIPKDGPSAGVTILAALASLMSGKPILPGIAMTGEITLRGTVLPVGGIKEKVLAAHRAGIHTVILPSYNLHDLSEIPESVRSALRFIKVDTIEEMLEAALQGTTANRPLTEFAGLRAS